MAARLGLDGADISVTHLPHGGPAALHAVRREAADVGVEIVMLATYSDFTHPEPAVRAREIDGVRALIAAGVELGVRFLRLTAGQNHPGIPPNAGLDWAAEGLAACLPDAAAAGVRLLYENHVRGAVWTYNDWTQPAERFLEVVRRTAGTPLGILFDTANCLVLHDDPLDVLRQVKDRVAAIHLSDIRRPGAFEPTVIGTGAAPIEPLLRIMVEHGFDGWVSIEEASRTGDNGFRKAVAFAEHAWLAAGGAPRHGQAQVGGQARGVGDR
jgi:sugar phosphate isomerase/epimerase